MEHDRQRGFSLMEILIVIALAAAVGAVAIPTLSSTLRYQNAQTAMFTTLGQLRSARQSAVDLRRSHRVTFAEPRTITVNRQQGAGWTQVIRISLPDEIEFRVEPGVPTTSTLTPDGFGASKAIDFGGQKEVFFLPDGSGVNSSGRSANGIIYLAEPGNLESARAVTLFGATGRIKAWTLVNGVWE